jgi:hypothetical protein
MYIELTTSDPKGNTQALLVNYDRVLGFKQRFHNDIGGNPIKDKGGYPKTYTEIIMRGLDGSSCLCEPLCTQFLVVETIETIKTLIEEKPIHED